MPLPAMAGSDESLMSSPGMTGAIAPLGDQGSQQVTPQDQVRGAIQVVSKVRQDMKEQLEGVATQFPAVSKSLKDLLAAFDRGLQGVVQELVKVTQMPEAAGPPVAR